VKRIIILVAAILLFSCATTKSNFLVVSSINKETNHFPSNKQAKVVLERKINLFKERELFVVPSGDNGEGEFFKKMVSQFGYFKKIVDMDEYEKELRDQKELTYKEGIKNQKIDIKPFLILTFKKRHDGNDQYMQIVVTEKTTWDDCFIAEIEYFKSKSLIDLKDESLWNPLLNSFSDYIQEYGKIKYL